MIHSPHVKKNWDTDNLQKIWENRILKAGNILTTIILLTTNTFLFQLLK